MGAAIDLLTTLRKAANSARMNAQAHPESRILRSHAEDVEAAEDMVAELLRVLRNAERLYSETKLVAGHVECGAWITDIRELLRNTTGATP